MGATSEDRGQALPLVILVVCFAALLAVGIGRLAGEAVLAGQAQTAADAAALAGAASGPGAARRAAEANGATVVVYERAGDEVEVVVERRGAQAVARARREGSTPEGQG